MFSTDKFMNIYFNSCFTQTAEAIKYLKENKRDLKIFITNRNENTHLRGVSDYYELEPKDLNEEEYLQFCLDFCRNNKIDIFFVRFNATELSKYKEEFDKINVKVTFVTDFDTYKLLDNKVETYKAIKNDNIVSIPPYGIATNYDEYIQLYDLIKKSGFTVCVKPIDGVGGIGFKRIKEDITAYDELTYGSFTSMSKERADFMFKSKGEFEPLMVLGYLEGDEYSIDCLAKDGVLIDAIPRVKISSYSQLITPKEELIEIAKKFTKKFNLSNIYNIQVKYHKGEIYLIEINTRMSGGTFKSCMSGVNIMSKIIDILDGEKVQSQIRNMKEIKITQRNDCYIDAI